MASAKFLLYTFFAVSLKRNNLHLIHDISRFLHVYYYYKYTAEHVDDNMIYL